MFKTTITQSSNSKRLAQAEWKHTNNTKHNSSKQSEENNMYIRQKDKNTKEKRE